MRGYIFTGWEREKLEHWLETGEEDQMLLNLFTAVRRNTTPLRRDLELMLRVVTELRRRKRWRGYYTEGSEFGSALRRAESASTRIGRGTAT